VKRTLQRNKIFWDVYVYVVFALKQLTTSEGPPCATSQKIKIYKHIDI